MFYKKESLEDYKRSQRKIDFEKFGSMLAVFLAYRFDGVALAGVVGLVFVIYSASEIQKLLNYQNFMKEKEIGLHDLD
jgi:hypothetical protein